jgi:hypothetical protein
MQQLGLIQCHQRSETLFLALTMETGDLIPLEKQSR